VGIDVGVLLCRVIIRLVASFRTLYRVVWLFFSFRFLRLLLTSLLMEVVFDRWVSRYEDCNVFVAVVEFY
jgi:hypothetical protein